jgi:hypothetical protein
MTTIVFPSATDFTQLDLADQSRLILNPDLKTITGTGAQYVEGTLTDPVGHWIVQGQKVTAGQILCAKMYGAFLKADSDSQTFLSSMNTNTALAKAASSLAHTIVTQATNGSKNSFTYNDLLTMADTVAPSVNMTAQEFITAVLPDELSHGTYTPEQFKALANIVNQYSNAKLTDNSVLQEKLNIATTHRNTCLDGISNLLKSWVALLQNIGKAI